jgi:hypothetical protein
MKIATTKEIRQLMTAACQAYGIPFSRSWTNAVEGPTWLTESRRLYWKVDNSQAANLLARSLNGRLRARGFSNQVRVTGSSVRANATLA